MHHDEKKISSILVEFSGRLRWRR